MEELDTLDLILEAIGLTGSQDKTGAKWGVTILQEGHSRNAGKVNAGLRRYYPGRTVQESARLFEGAWVNEDHATEEEMQKRPGGSVGKRVGFLSEVRAVQEGGKWKLRGVLNVIREDVRRDLKNAWDMGRRDYAGLSINARATGFSQRRLPDTSELVETVDGLREVHSVDLVTTPAAGGALDTLLEGAIGGDSPTMDIQDQAGQAITLEGIQALLAGAVQEAATKAAEEATARFELLLESALAEESLLESGDHGQASMFGAGADDDEEDDEDEPAPPRRKRGKQSAGVRESQETLDAVNAVREELAATQFALYRAEHERLIESAVTDLPEVSQERLRGQLGRLLEAGALDEDGITNAVKEEREYMSRLTSIAPRGTPGNISVLPEGSLTGIGGYRDRMIATFDGGRFQDSDGKVHEGFNSVKEAFFLWPEHQGMSVFDTDPRDILGALHVPYGSWKNGGLVQESLATASWGQVMADVMYQSMMREAAALPYNDWTKFISQWETVTDFRDHRWLRVGLYDNLDLVPEGAPYQPLTSPGDEEIYYRIAKYGGLEDVTLEAIANDKLGALTPIPRRMAYAWSRTIYEMVMDTITSSNPTLTNDSVALYDAAHANTFAYALTVAGANLAQIKLRKQKPYGAPTTEFMGERNRIRYAIVPPELEARANAVFNPSDAFQATRVPVGDSNGAITADLDAQTSIDPFMFKGRNIEVIVYDKMALASNGTTRWYLTAAANLANLLVFGSFRGRREPELFVQGADERSGAAFTADKVTYKIRAFAGIGVMDHRSMMRLTPGE